MPDPHKLCCTAELFLLAFLPKIQYDKLVEIRILEGFL